MIERQWPTLGLAALWLASACGHGAAKGPSGTEVTQTPGAAAPTVTPAKVEPAKATSSTGRAVVRSGGRLYYASTGDISIKLPPLEGTPGVAVDVVGEQDGRLVIETLGSAPADYHCAAVMDGLRHVRLRFYVAKDELLPVLTAELEHDFGDGTAVRLAPGVPVPPDAGALLVRGTPIRVPVSPEHLGRVYEPRPPFLEGGDDGLLHPAGTGGELRYGGEPLAEEHLYRDGAAVRRYATMPREHDELVIVRNACLEVVAAVPAERLRPSPPSSTVGAKVEHGEDPLGDDAVWKRLKDEHRVAEQQDDGIVHSVAAGAAIQWVDGSPAGWVTSKHRLVQTRHDVDGRACFDVPLLTTENAAVVLCFAAGDVLTLGHPRPGSTGRSDRLTATDASRSSGFGGRGKPLPRVRQGKAKREGPLDEDIIRRIVRAHINELRACYVEGLARNATLAGTISIRFKIVPLGKVKSASTVDTTLADPAVSKCIVTVFERLKFPKSSNERPTLVIVPLVLEPA